MSASLYLTVSPTIKHWVILLQRAAAEEEKPQSLIFLWRRDLKMFNKNNSRQQFWDKMTLKLVSAVNKPLSINTHTHTHDLTPHTLNCVHPGPGLIFRCWLAVRGAQRAVRGKELGDRLSWAELWEGDRQRETDRQADGGKSGHLGRQAAGSHGGVTGRMVLSCSVSARSASQSYETTARRRGTELMERRAENYSL